MKNLLFVFSFLLIALFPAAAQECDCSKSFSWMVTTFEQNDAGFQYVIDKKGAAEYRKHTDLFTEKVKGLTALQDCQGAMYEWLLYFRPGHIGVGIKDPDPVKQDNEPSEQAIRRQYQHEKTVDLTEKQLIAILEKKKNRHPIEGIWTNGSYRAGIIIDRGSDSTFTAFIISADNVYWMPKQVKASFKLNNDRVTFTAQYAMRNHTRQATTARVIGDAQSLLLLYNNYWVRAWPKSTLTKKEKLLVAFSAAELPFAEKLSDSTVYLRIPSFAADQKKNIDSVLALNHRLISTMPYLMIDIRNGTGGSDDSYSKILPYLYTQPIRGVGVQLYATELNAKAFDKYALQYEDTSEINYCHDVARQMRVNLGKFITHSESTFSMDTLDRVMPYPRKVAIICNHNNGSTDEQFLIDAKQSSKVKVFGRPTGGMLDISNINMVDFPDGHFGLAYCMSKSYRIPDYCIDGTGIQPDYFMDDAIPETDWIDHIKAVLEH